MIPNEVYELLVKGQSIMNLTHARQLTVALVMRIFLIVKHHYQVFSFRPSTVGVI